ncbi:hypothetical protein [Marimonas arenosa]|uniref:Uncharacterized protein n=1 Tax=Marimonas arenosa TaxID=1795305 RepID=A0AAE3W9V7_9RHOB|nr:hypothetical protein [Marimonas arenosa]MDQ2088754.1 hypothetical protein [Marimonas arenosa]
MTNVTPTARDRNGARHARLFELIRQNNIAAQHGQNQSLSAPAAPQHTIRQFAQAARTSLLPEEQQALGISASFGR